MSLVDQQMLVESLGSTFLTIREFWCWWSEDWILWKADEQWFNFLKPNLISKLMQIENIHFSSVQFSRSVVSSSLRPHESQHARPPCPSSTPGVHSDSHPSSQWCYPAISSSAMASPSSPAPNPSQHHSLFQWVNSSHQVVKVLEFQL